MDLLTELLMTCSRMRTSTLCAARWRRQKPPLKDPEAASWFAESAAARRLDDEHVAFLHLDLEGRTEVLARAVDALHPVAADLAWRAACHAERRHAAGGGGHGRGPS